MAHSVLNPSLARPTGQGVTVSTSIEGPTPDIVRISVDSADRELAFYRGRSGQIYLVALSAEALIIVGREQINVANAAAWVAPSVLSTAFLGVAVVGTVLGSEYRRRIHALKRARHSLLKRHVEGGVHPAAVGDRVSEIQVLYFVLWFTSIGGCLVSWLRTYPTSRVLGVAALLYASSLVVVAWRGMRRAFAGSPAKQPDEVESSH
jgi:hypothetical protein